MDVSKFAEVDAQHDQAVTGPILQPDGEPFLAEDGSECTVSVVSEYSQRVQDALSAHHRKIQKLGAKQDVAQAIKAYSVAKTAAAIVGWSGWTSNGEPWPCTPENAHAFVQSPHRRAQVEELMARHASFFAKS